MSNVNKLVWVEKYRPSTLAECILPNKTAEYFSNIVTENQPQNLLLFGKSGSGKTTAAKAIAEELGATWMLINCSEESGIDTLRTKVRNFATTMSLNGKMKIIILDEFDYANQQSFQVALRGAIEEFSSNCNFIITCNYPSKIIEQIHSRCTKIDFTIPSSEKAAIAMKMFERAKFILDEEKIPYKEEVLVELIKKNFPDFRKTISELQRYALCGGVIDVGILTNNNQDAIKKLVQLMKDKKFSDCRKWVVENTDMLRVDFYRILYDALAREAKPETLPLGILAIAEYQYKAAFVADQEINATALIVQLMMDVEYK